MTIKITDGLFRTIADIMQWSLVDAGAKRKAKKLLTAVAPLIEAQVSAEIEELRSQNDILVQTTAELCDRCGWRMKFPGQPCRHCEAPAIAALKEGEKKDD